MCDCRPFITKSNCVCLKMLMARSYWLIIHLSVESFLRDFMIFLRYLVFFFVSLETFWWLYLIELLLNYFFFLLFYHEKYSIKDICVYSKSKIKTKVTSKQILEHFKMMNQRLFIHKLCNNSEMLLSSSWAIFIRVLVFLSSPAFLHLSTCVFCFY